MVRVTIDVLDPQGQQVVGAMRVDTTVNPKPNDVDHEASLGQVTVKDMADQCVEQVHQRLEDWAVAWKLQQR